MIRVAVIELGNSRLCVLCVYAVHQAPRQTRLLRTAPLNDCAGRWYKATCRVDVS